MYLSRGECPECKQWDPSGDYAGHYDLDGMICGECGTNWGDEDA